MSQSDTILSALADGVLSLTLNRPDKLNAFNEEMHVALRAGFEQAHADGTVRAVLLTGAGRGFCAGQDLGDRDPKKGVPDLGHTIETYYNPLLRLIRSLEKPVICAVNGVAAGAGANIAFACDITLAARSASFGSRLSSKIGLVPDSGGYLPCCRASSGEARARALGDDRRDRSSADTAAELGPHLEGHRGRLTS
jgi:2-(1,2-epoxy-1,2-dihydrophenyl)acetyl-CoA isomerase